MAMAKSGQEPITAWPFFIFDLDAEIICKSTVTRNAKHLTETQNIYIYLSNQLQLKVTLWMEEMDFNFLHI